MVLPSCPSLLLHAEPMHMVLRLSVLKATTECGANDVAHIGRPGLDLAVNTNMKQYSHLWFTCTANAYAVAQNIIYVCGAMCTYGEPLVHRANGHRAVELPYCAGSARSPSKKPSPKAAFL